MSNFQERAIEEALRSELGQKVRFSRYVGENRTPTKVVLDEVERQIGPQFSVYWAKNASPEVFVLPGLSPSPVVFSTRYLTLTSVMRHLFADDSLNNILVDVAERTTLKLMAELALRKGDPDYAVLAFVRSTAVIDWRLLDDDDDNHVMALESAPINEAYMATWFYGLVHELGHLSPSQTERFPDNHPFSDAGILDAITVALDNFPYPDSIKHAAIERAKQQRSSSVLGIDQVRSEGLADIFAASVLFQATLDIMHEINQERFDVTKFIAEMLIFLNIVAIIDRCRRVASIASATTANPEAHFESALHPVSVLVRALIQRAVYLESAVTRYVFDTDAPTREQFQRVEKLINEIHKDFSETINRVDSGLARAMEFSLFPERRENDWALLEAFREKVLNSTGFDLVEAQRFCKLADTLEADGKLLQTLKGIVDDPSKPLRPDATGDLAYFVPWVEGPNGFNRPFGLDTKHGHLVFVFLDQGEFYDVFFKASAELLKPGFTLKKALVPVPRKERLGPELATNMPAGQPFLIIVEGTEEFTRYMQELSDDTIWED